MTLEAHEISNIISFYALSYSKHSPVHMT